MSLIDIGANLTHESFADDLPDVLGRATAAGVTRLIVTGADLASSRAARELAHAHDVLYATAGIHPHHAGDATPHALRELQALLDDERVVAVGETGLDFFRDFSPRDVQARSFEAHMEIAARNQMPLFLHERDAYPRFADMLRVHRADLGKVVVHCFTGERSALHAYLDLDCHIGITGWICDERRGAHLLELVQDIPAERLMIETDAPYLMPRTLRPKPRTRRNEPCHLAHIAAFVAERRGIDAASLAAQTTDNAADFFGLPAP